MLLYESNHDLVMPIQFHLLYRTRASSRNKGMKSNSHWKISMKGWSLHE